MLEIKITVSCPDLVLAATTLAKCLHPNNAVDTPASPAVPAAPVTTATPAAPIAQPVIPAGPAAPIAQPVTPAVPAEPIAQPVPVMPVAPTVPPAPASAPVAPPVPLAPAPQYSLDQIARAGADLVTREPAKAAAAQQLLTSFGVQTVSELPKERFGEFVTALRGLGASI